MRILLLLYYSYTFKKDSERALQHLHRGEGNQGSIVSQSCTETPPVHWTELTEVKGERVAYKRPEEEEKCTVVV